MRSQTAAEVARGRTATGGERIPFDPADGMWQESWRIKWGRRLVSFPGLLLFTALSVAAVPFALPLGIAIDTLRRRRQVLARFILLIPAVAIWHCVGVGILFCLWLHAVLARTPVQEQRHRARIAEANWSRRVFAIAESLYGCSLVVEGDELVNQDAAILFCRHVSVLDTIVPIFTVGRSHGLTMRIVKKFDLLWDPCIDVVSRRLPRAFVRRTGTAADLDTIRNLMRGMQRGDVLALFPEGTRFTPKKRAHILAKMQQKGDAAYERAERLQHVLPPRLGGAMTALSERPDLDVIFCAHVGLEGTALLADFVAGSMLDRKVCVKFWRVPAAEIPFDSEGKAAWLQQWWERVDHWVGAHAPTA